MMLYGFFWAIYHAIDSDGNDWADPRVLRWWWLWILSTYKHLRPFDRRYLRAWLKRLCSTLQNNFRWENQQIEEKKERSEVR